MQQVCVIPESAQPNVAMWAKKVARFAGGMVVVQRQVILQAGARVYRKITGSADGTLALLGRNLGVVFFAGETIHSREAIAAHLIAIHAVTPNLVPLIKAGSALFATVVAAVVMLFPRERVAWSSNCALAARPDWIARLAVDR